MCIRDSYFGVVNQEAQAKAEVSDGDFTYYSNEDNLFKEHDDSLVYATLEENFTRVDGSMYFLPRESPSALYLDTGLVGKDLVSEAQYAVSYTHLALFAGAFKAHHRFVKQETIDKIYAAMPNKEYLIGKLAEMYNEPIIARMEEPDNKAGKNVEWTTNW